MVSDNCFKYVLYTACTERVKILGEDSCFLNKLNIYLSFALAAIEHLAQELSEFVVLSLLAGVYLINI